MAKDCSYQFAVEHDEKFVYIAVKTTDDKSVLNPLKEPWSQDGVEIRFDARPEPERSQGRGRGEFKEILVVSMSPSGEARRRRWCSTARDQLPTDVKAVCVKTPTGHAAEIAIPASYLNERQGGAWTAVSDEHRVDDYDTSRRAAQGAVVAAGLAVGRRRTRDRGRFERKMIADGDSKQLTFVVMSATRTAADFEVLAAQAARLKSRGRVEVGVSSLAERTISDIPPGGSPWHDYTTLPAVAGKILPASRPRSRSSTPST